MNVFLAGRSPEPTPPRSYALNRVYSARSDRTSRKTLPRLIQLKVLSSAIAYRTSKPAHLRKHPRYRSASANLSGIIFLCLSSRNPEAASPDVRSRTVEQYSPGKREIRRTFVNTFPWDKNLMEIEREKY